MFGSFHCVFTLCMPRGCGQAGAGGCRNPCRGRSGENGRRLRNAGSADRPALICTRVRFPDARNRKRGTSDADRPGGSWVILGQCADCRYHDSRERPAHGLNGNTNPARYERSAVRFRYGPKSEMKGLLT